MPYTKQNPITGDTITQTMLRAMETQYEEALADMSAIKSIQHGSTSISSGSLSQTTTITSVNTAKAFIVVRNVGNDNANGDIGTRVEITNATTVTVARGSNNNSYTVYWTVVEFA